MALHVIEKADMEEEKRSARSGSISRPGGRRVQTYGRWAVSLAGAAGDGPCDAFRTAAGARRASPGLFSKREGATTWVQITNS